MNNRTLRRLLVAASATALTFTLAACGSNSSDAAPTPGAAQTATNGDVFNDADIQFATDMIPHHTQALEMVKLTDGRTLSPAVRTLAEAIRNAQTPEVEQMSGWLTNWGKPVPSTTSSDGSAGMDMSGMDGSSGMPGMMTQTQMDDLKNASDAEFEQLWLQMMVEHHTGAVDMAKTEETTGQFAEAITLAQSIETSQTAEITTMQSLLK